jgi:branched-chain amino acid transport system permease protein
MFVQALNGLVTGTLYVSVALGLSIVFGLLGVVNFSHGILYALGAYLAVTMSGLGFGPSLLIAPLIVAVLAMLLEVTAIRRFYQQDPSLGLLFTFGLALVGQEIIRVIWGPTGKPFSIPSGLDGSLNILGFEYSTYRVFVLGITVVAIGLLWLLLNRTPVGLIIRAGSRDPEMVRMLGIKLRPVFTLVFGLGGALAALAGVMAAPLAGVQPAMGTDILTAAFVVVVIGGLGSFWGVVVSGLMVGIVVGLARAYWPPMSEASMFLLMAAVLLIRPRGLFGEEWKAFE